MAFPLVPNGNRALNLTTQGFLLQSGRTIDYDGQPNYMAKTGSPDGSLNGFATYTLSLTNGVPTGSPVTLAAPSSSALSITATSTNPLSLNPYSLQITGSGGTLTTATAGMAVGTPAFTIPREAVAKMLTIKFSYEVTSGLANLNLTSGSAATFAMWIYNVNAATWSQPSNCYPLVQGAGTAFTSPIQFQTSGTASENVYQVFLMVQNSISTNTYTLPVDNWYCGPQSTANVPALTDWTSYSPTGPWTSGVTYSGLFRRVGNEMEVRAKVAVTGSVSPAVVGGVTLPSGYTFDTSKLVFGSVAIVGKGLHVATNSIAYDMAPYIASSSSTNLISFGGLQNFAAPGSGTVFLADTDFNTVQPIALGSGAVFMLEFKVPIAGWGSNLLVGSDAGDGRVVDFSGITANTSVTASVTPINLSVRKDTHGAWTGTQYNVPIAGDYAIVGTTVTNCGAANSVRAYVNGTPDIFLGVNASTGQSRFAISGMIPSLRAGDIITLRVDTTGNVIGSSSGDAISIFKVQGPSAIAAGETQTARYTNTAGQSFAASTQTTITGWTMDYATHAGTFNASTGVFTANSSGKFEFTAYLSFNNTVTWESGSWIDVSLYKNGALYCSIGRSDELPAAQTRFRVIGCSPVPVPLNANESVYIVAYQSGAATKTLYSGGAASNWLAIKKVGN